jgi:hypothetical protein
VSGIFNLVKNQYFDPEELISVDLIRHARVDYSDVCYGDNTNDERRSARGDGPFLRLSDGSGWILARQCGQDFVRRLPVEDAPASEKFWTFYADNIPFGVELRRHPVEQLNNTKDTNRFSPACGGITYLPMQKIVCDRKISHGGTTFYRVQGTCGWVFDKRNAQRHNNSNNTKENDSYRQMMIEGNLVETGLFAFRMISSDGMAIRKFCHVGDGTNNTDATVKPGEIIVADIVRHSPLHNGNGPFLRLTDGSGWLFQHKHDCRPLLEEVPITNGKFRLMIRSAHGIKPRGQPIDSYYYRDHDRVSVLKQGDSIMCDRKISSPSGITFYRKKGTNFWIFDKHNDETIAEIVPEQGSPCGSLLGKTARHSNDDNFDNGVRDSWSPHFIRGNANAIHGLEEIDFDPQRKVISYSSSDAVIINVYFDTRTIGTVLDNSKNANRRTKGQEQRFYRQCNDAELQAILRDPTTYQRGIHQSNKRARLMPTPIDTLSQNKDSIWDGDDSISNFWSESGQHPITPDSSLSSNIEDDHEIDDFDAEQETRLNLLDCQQEIRNLRYREGNLLRAIQMHEEQRIHEAQSRKMRAEQINRFRTQKEEENRRRRLEQEAILRRIEEQRRLERNQRDRSGLIFENLYIGSMVGCLLGLVLSPVFGPILVREFGLQHLLG